jgi:RHS repeat-associated protein
LSTQPLGPEATREKVYLSWILLDEQQLKLVSSGSGFASINTKTFNPANGKMLMQANGGLPIVIPKNGYLYVYVSSEVQKMNAYFDDIRVEHVRGALLEETQYYPFGLTMKNINSKAAGSKENKYKYNGIEYENSFDINIGETFFRSHDPQLGRWLQIDPKVDIFFEFSPYTAMGNNPISIIDPRGDEIPITVYDDNGKAVKKKNVTNDQISKIVTMYQTEYGISVSYDKKNGTLVYAGEAKTDLKVSADAKAVMMKQLAKGEISEHKIAIGTGLGINTKTNELSFGNKSASGDIVMAGAAATNGKISYFDLGLVNSDLSLSEKSFKWNTFPDFGDKSNKRTFNFARIFEHDFVAHNVMGIGSDGTDPVNSTGPAEAVVNTYRTQMGLSNVQAKNYQTNNIELKRALKYFGDPSTGKTNAILEINPNFPR